MTTLLLKTQENWRMEKSDYRCLPPRSFTSSFSSYSSAAAATAAEAAAAEEREEELLVGT